MSRVLFEAKKTLVNALTIQFEQLLDECCDLAGRSLPLGMKYYRMPELKVREKADKTPASEADDAIGLFLREELSRRYGWPVIMEETYEEDQEGIRTAGSAQGPIWWVDPIDGTRNFLVADGEFSILIGLTIHGVPVLGVILVPEKDDLFFAASGVGAWRMRSSTRERITVRPDADRVLMTKFPTETGRARAIEYYAGRGYRPDQIVQIGSAYKSGLVAAGEFAESVSLDDFSLWDVCASDAILREAGGVMLELPGLKPFCYDPLGEMKRHGYSARAAKLG